MDLEKALLTAFITLITIKSSSFKEGAFVNGRLKASVTCNSFIKTSLLIIFI
jgi:hypothetical protein